MQIPNEFFRKNPLFSGEGSYGDRAIAVLTDGVFVPFLGAEAKGQTFTPSGISGQLAIGGTNVASRAEVTALIRTDWQGALTLSKNSRTNLLKGSVLAGGATPTEWTVFSAGTGSVAGATSTLDTAYSANALLFTCTTAAREFIYQTVVLAPGQQYILTLWVESAPAGTLAPSDIFSYGTAPADILVTYPACPANPSGGSGGVLTTGRLDVLVYSYTGGNFDPRIGLGASGTLDGVAVRLSHPQFEIGQTSESWIPTTTAAASVTDFNYTDAGVVTLGQTASGTYTWTGSGILQSGSALNIPDTTPSTLTTTGLADDGTSKALSDTSPGVLTLLGFAASLLIAIADVAPAALALTGYAGTVLTGTAVPDTTPTALALAGQSGAGLTLSLADTTPAAQTLTGYAGAVASTVPDTTPTALTTTGLAGNGVALAFADAAPGSMAITGHAGTVQVALVIQDTAPATLALTGQSGAGLTQTLADSAPASLTLTGYAGSVSQSGGIPDGAPAALTLTGLPGALRTSYSDSAPAALVATGQVGSISVAQADAAPAALALVGYAGTVSYFDHNTPLSAERTWRVPYEARVWAIAAELRLQLVATEVRSPSIPAETRTITISAEDRSITWPPA